MGLIGEFFQRYEEGKALGEAVGLLSKDMMYVRAELTRRVLTCSGAQLDLFEAALEQVAAKQWTPWGRRHGAEVLEMLRNLRG